MFANPSRKRKSSRAHDDCTPRRSQHLELRAAGHDRTGTQASPTEASPPSLSTPPPSAAPVKPGHGLEFTLSRNDEDEDTSFSRLDHQQRKEFTFFSFPGELRNMIYDYSLHYPDSRRLYAPFYRCHNLKIPSTKWKPRLRAPTILLLNKRITNECLPILKSTKLVIDRLPPPRTCDIYSHPFDYSSEYPTPSHFMRLSDFISPRTLQNISQIDINVGLCEGPLGSGWAWRPVVDELLAILTRRNTCEKLRLLIRLCNMSDYPIVALSDRDYQVHMIKKIDKFANVNPNIFARHEVKVDVWQIDGQMATFVSESNFPQPLPVMGDNQHEQAWPEKEPIPPPRMYPDREMFPGSVMEFVKPAPPPFYNSDDSD